MEEDKNLFETLLERAVEYSKTSYNLTKLQAVEKTSDVVSSLLPHTIVLGIAFIFIFFGNIGLAFWIGEMVGHLMYGFFIVSAFYGITGIVMHFFLHKWFKKCFRNSVIRKLLN